MNLAYLEVTYRQGKILAAYYHVPHALHFKSARTERMEPGLIADVSANGEALGIEITAPSLLTLPILNAALARIGCAPATFADIEPLVRRRG